MINIKPNGRDLTGIIMKNKFYKKFTSKKELFTAICDATSFLDKGAMLESLKYSGPRRLYVITSSGEKIACDNFKKFAASIHCKTDLDVLYPICFGRGEVFHVYTKEDYFHTVVKEEVVEQEVEEKLEEKTIELVSPEETSEKVPVDYRELEKLFDKDSVRESKNKLEDIVKDKYGIDLRKNQSFDNMILELKEALGDK